MVPTGVQVHALASAQRVACVARDGASSGHAQGRPVGRAGASLPAAATILGVAIEAHAGAGAGRVAAFTGQLTGRAFAARRAVGRAWAFFGAFAAICRILGQIHTGAVAGGGAAGATARAFAGVAHVAAGAGGGAAAAVVGIFGDVHAHALAFAVAGRAGDRALTSAAGRFATDRCIANVVAFAAVAGAGLQIDAAIAALGQRGSAVELASGLGTYCRAARRHRATLPALAAVLHIFGRVHASGGAVGQPARTLSGAHAVRAHLTCRADGVAVSAVLGVAALVDAAAATVFEWRATSELTIAALAGGRRPVRLRADVPASPTIVGIFGQIQATRAARNVPALATERAVVADTHARAIGGRAAASPAAATVVAVILQRDAGVAAHGFALIAAERTWIAAVSAGASGAGIGLDVAPAMSSRVAGVTRQAATVGVTRSSVELAGELGAAGHDQHREQQPKRQNAPQH